ncbi:MAG: TSUP family transporter [Clostridia bacterium]|nr:TSUP family transporter [Clostridia bacterium]
MFYVSLVIGAILAGAGIGGGSVFVLLNDIFKTSSHMGAMVYNLLMFIFVGITATVSNIKHKNFDKTIFIKMIFFCIVSSVIGATISQKIEEKNLKEYFNIFILIIGIYEIISSLKTIFSEKNINVKKGA